MTPEDDLVERCIECGELWDDHVLRDYREHWPKARPGANFSYDEIPADQPHEEVQVGDFADHILLGTAVAVLPPEVARAAGCAAYGVLRFTFMNGNQVIATQNVVMSDQNYRDLRVLVSKAVDDVIKKARRRR